MIRLFLAIKYWMQGDSWGEAWNCSGRIVNGFKRPQFSEKLNKYR